MAGTCKAPDHIRCVVLIIASASLGGVFGALSTGHAASLEPGRDCVVMALSLEHGHGNC